MRTLAALAVLASLLVLPGCPAGGFGCGAPDDTAAVMVLGREDDTLVLCVNDGYAATLDGGARVLEGRYAWEDELRRTCRPVGA
ncbi:MAG TPA: hypothetical protein VM513_26740, partial [Kofleriaceae bacterium]|nr:hypothetical protein [Kofleriaceae bacterium]